MGHGWFGIWKLEFASVGNKKEQKKDIRHGFTLMNTDESGFSGDIWVVTEQCTVHCAGANRGAFLALETHSPQGGHVTGLWLHSRPIFGRCRNGVREECVQFDWAGQGQGDPSMGRYRGCPRPNAGRWPSKNCLDPTFTYIDRRFIVLFKVTQHSQWLLFADFF